MKKPHNADRVLGAIYKLAHGRPDVLVLKDELYALIERERLFKMTDEEYATWKAQTILEASTWRDANGS